MTSTTRAAHPTLPRTLGIAGGASALRILAGIGSSVVVARGLGPEGRGQLSFVLNSLSVLLMFSAAGSFAAITRVTSARRARPEELYRPSLRVGLVLGSAWAGAFLLLSTVLRTTIFSGVAAMAIALVALALPPTVVVNYWSGLAAASDRLQAYSVAAALGAVAYLLSSVGLLGIGYRSPWGFVAAWIACSLLPGLVLLPTCRAATRTEPVTWPSLARIAMAVGFGDISVLLVLRADVFAVKAYRGFREVGVYAVATAFAELVLQAGVTLRQALLSRQGDADRHALPLLLARISRLVFGAGLVLAVGLAVIARPAVTLVFGGDYALAAGAIVMLVPGTLLVALQGPLRDYLVVEGRARAADRVAVLSLIGNVALNVLLLRHHTFLVAAATSSLAYLVNFSACALVFRRVTGIGLRKLLIPTRSDLTAILRRAA